jgi:hypothetical protein
MMYLSEMKCADLHIGQRFHIELREKPLGATILAILPNENIEIRWDNACSNRRYVLSALEKAYI